MKMALARAAGGGHGLRAQKRPLQGTRPAPLEEVSEPQVVDGVTVGYVAAPGPLLSAPVLADTVADAVDQSTVTYLLQAALLKKKEKEEEEERKAVEAARRAAVRAWKLRHTRVKDELNAFTALLPSCAGRWSLRRSSKSSMPPGPGPPQLLLHPGRR